MIIFQTECLFESKAKLRNRKSSGGQKPLEQLSKRIDDMKWIHRQALATVESGYRMSAG